VIGAGHNGLILAAYLARAGLRVLAVDRLETMGGGLMTIEDAAGFRHNPHSVFHRALTQMPWYRDLDLARHGAEYIEPELNVALLLNDGRSIQWWTDFERTADSFAQISKRDAATLRKWRDDFVAIVAEILTPETRSPPLPKARRRELLQKTPEGRLLLQTSELSPFEFVIEYFEHPAIQAGLLFFNGLREVDLRAKGLGYHIPALLASPAKAQLCRGGSMRLAQALAGALHEAGGEIRTGVTPRKILVEQGRAIGIETTAGETLQARQFVASSLDPHQTFLELIDPRHLPQIWRERAAGFRYNRIAPLFALNVNLREPPRYRAAQSDPELDRAFMVILGLDHVDQCGEIVRHNEAGTVPPTRVMWGACPTRFDPLQAPAGKHTAFLWEKLPYRLNGDARNWDRYAPEHGRRMLETWRAYAPNLADAVIGSFVGTPLDIERRFPNMREGDLLVGTFDHGQIGHDRPFPGAGHYRGHLEGLYLCGSCCHPGGNITGLPGYNAAQIIVSDLGLRPAWLPEPIEQHLMALAQTRRERTA
jgi:phytoene dehydrogenase-like protein